MHRSFIIYMLTIHHAIAKQYDNYTLYKCIPENGELVEYLRKLGKLYKIDFWRDPGLPKIPVDFLVSPKRKTKINTHLKKYNITCSISLENVQRVIDEQTMKPYTRTLPSFDWKTYYRLKDIYNWIYDLKKKYSNEMKVVIIGKTEQKRDILVAIIRLKGSSERSKIFIEGGIHAREWISPAVVTYLMNYILSNTDHEFLKIARMYKWIFLPVLNPDGYEFSHTKDRLWRKNINNVDLNRNFDYHFGSIGVSHDENDTTYCGPKAFSEKETSALANFLKDVGHQLEYYISFHSYGQYILLPFADRRSKEGNYFFVKPIIDNTAHKISKRFNTEYNAGNAFETVGYLVSGCSTDWVKSKYSVPYAVVFELRDKGSHGFLLPEREIIPTAQETIDGLKVLLTPHTDYFSPSRVYPLHRNVGILSFNKANKIIMICSILALIKFIW